MINDDPNPAAQSPEQGAPVRLSQRLARCLNPELGPKKILACDGGGIRGLLSVEILAEIEAQLRRQTGRSDLVLGEYFDFVCGTSTGAIVAACIACGMEVDRIRNFYLEHGSTIFDRSSVLKRLQYSYDKEPLSLLLKEELNKALGLSPNAPPAELGDENLMCLLMMVMRNHSTDSPWPIWNHPFAHYNRRDRKDCNLKLPLWQLVRASTAAPTYFPPELITLAAGTPDEYAFVFVDGGVTTYNNPAFLAFQMATVEAYRLGWKAGSDRLLVVSVGTGSAPMARPDDTADSLWLLDHAKQVPNALMNAASAGWDMACRSLGSCRFGPMIDREFGQGLAPKPGASVGSASLFSYMRYNPELTDAGMQAIGLTDVDPVAARELDAVQKMADLQAIGRAYAKASVRAEHFAGF